MFTHQAGRFDFFLIVLHVYPSTIVEVYASDPSGKFLLSPSGAPVINHYFMFLKKRHAPYGVHDGVQFWILHKYILSSSCVFLANRLEYLPYGRALATSVAMAPSGPSGARRLS